MKIIISVFLAITLLFITPVRSEADNDIQAEKKAIPVEVLKDKIRGGLLGQILGNLNGIPHEGRYINDPGNVKNYVPSLPNGAWTDDDTDFEWFYICEMQKNRSVYLSAEAISELWKERVNRGVYCSNRFSRYLMDLGIKPPFTGYSTFNPWAGFNISGQFLCETYGLVAPGMPQTAARIGLNYTTVAINNEPAQTTQLFTTMVSTAFFEKDINKIIDAGMVALDNTSIIGEVINDVKKWHAQYPENWRETRRLLKEKYTQEDGKHRDRNGHELNTGSIIAALLYGNGDFAESLKFAFNFGWDADCNAATVGTIVGVIHGYRKMLNHNDRFNSDWLIVDRYRNTTRDFMPMNETITSFADRIIELFEMVNEDNVGGKAFINNAMVYQIPLETPAQLIKLSSMEAQKQLLQNQFGRQIAEGIASTDREERARAAYMAICLDMSSGFAESKTNQWEKACFDLGGYWKVMNNIYSGNFLALEMFQEKFERAGFTRPAKKYSRNEIFSDAVFWKDPDEIY